MIEMYPYSPLDYVEVEYDGEKVKIRLPVPIDKHIPMNPEEWLQLRKLLSQTTHEDEKKYSESILKKIDSIIPTGNFEPNLATQALIKKAIETKSVLVIGYWKRDKREKESRSVQPWIYWEASDDYLLAFDLEKKEFRSFRLDCILSAELSNQATTELPESAKDWLDRFSQLISQKQVSSTTLVQLWLTESASYHLGQRIELKPISGSKSFHGIPYRLFSSPLVDEQWFVHTILSYGKSAIIHSPESLQQRVIQILGDIVSTNSQ